MKIKAILLLSAVSAASANTGLVFPTYDPRAVHLEGVDVQTQATFDDVDHSPDAVGEILYDNTVAGIDDGWWCSYDDDEIKYFLDIDTLPTDAEDDYAVAYDKDTDKLYWFDVATIGDITSVWTDTAGDVGAMTAASGDSLDASLADSTIPWRVHTIPSTLTEGAATWDSDDDILAISDGTALRYVAYGSNTGAALTGDVATAFFSSGTIEHERGGLEADISGYTDGFYGVASGSTININTSAEAIAAMTDETGTGAMVFGTSPTIDSPTFTTDITATGLIADDEIDYSAVTLEDFDYQTAWRVFYSDTNGDVTELALGASGSYLQSNGASAAPIWATPSGVGDPVLVDTTAISDGSGVDLTSGVGVDITLNAAVSPDTATFALDATEIDAVTWSDGVNASNVWTFDVSGTDHTLTAGNGLMTFSAAVTAVGTITGGTLTDGTASLNAGALTGLTTPLTVAQGGSGAATFTDGGILLGSAAGAFTALGAASNGQIPIGDGTTDPVLATITGTASEITVTNGAGTITLSLPNHAGTDITADLEEEVTEGSLADDVIVEADLKVVDAAADEDIFTYEVTTGDFEWHSAAEMGIGTATAIADGLIIEPDLDADVAAIDGDFLQYDSTGTNFTWRSGSETLTDIGAEGDLANEAGLYAALSDVTDFVQTTETAALDFGGATSFELVNGHDNVTNAEGEIAWDSTHDWIEAYDGATSVVVASKMRTAQATIWDPDTIQSTEDAVPLLEVQSDWAPHGITIVDIELSADASNSGSYNLEEWTTPTDGAPVTIETVAFSAATEAVDDGTLADAAVAAGSFVFLDLDTTALNFLTVSFTYYVNDD